MNLKETIEYISNNTSASHDGSAEAGLKKLEVLVGPKKFSQITDRIKKLSTSDTSVAGCFESIGYITFYNLDL